MKKYKCPYCNKTLKHTKSRIKELKNKGYIIFKHSCKNHILWNLNEEPKEFEWIYKHLKNDNINYGVYNKDSISSIDVDDDVTYTQDDYKAFVKKQYCSLCGTQVCMGGFDDVKYCKVFKNFMKGKVFLSNIKIHR